MNRATIEQAVRTLDWRRKKNIHAAYLEQVLDPTLVPENVVVFGNLPAHQVAGLSELVETRGARLLYLPLYSPDFNPIELAFSSKPGCVRPRPAPARP